MTVMRPGNQTTSLTSAGSLPGQALPPTDALPPSPPWTATPETSDVTALEPAADLASATGAAAELPSPPWTATAEQSAAPPAGDPGSASAPAGKTGAGAERVVAAERPAEKQQSGLSRLMRQPILRRHVQLAAAAVAGAALVFTGGWLVGARDPLLAPVRLSPAPTAAGLTAAERVYATVNPSVVTISVPGGASGSGFFYRTDRVVTNDHVVASSPDVLARLAQGQHPKVTVTLADGRVRSASVLGVDPRLDVAVLTLPSGLGVRPLAFGDSADVTVGAPAIVVGTPFGLAASVSAGIVSNVDRSSQFSTDPVQTELIQTDAAVNPGNSGGPLLDSSAAVIGIVTLRPDSANGRSTQGLAFALPSDAVVDAVDQLERYGKVSHPQLGVQLAAPDADRAGERGALVASVVSGSPAAAAGLRAGDQILSLGEREVHGPADFARALGSARAGDRVQVVLLRDGHTSTVPVTLRERPASS